MRRDLDRLAAEEFDVAVVGGGIHGAWIALRCAEAGLSVALVERDDFGAATSANSLKILHGGLRYLQHLDLARMRSSIRARREFARRHPRFVRPLPCLMPLAATGIRSPWVLGPALLANDILSADRNHGLQPAVRLPMGRLLGGASTAGRLARLRPSSPVAGALWWDALADDVSRCVIEPLLLAANLGAAIANRVEARSLRIASGRVHGLDVLDRLTGRALTVRATSVVDAAGPWAGRLAREAGLRTDYLPPAWIGAMNVVLDCDSGLDVAVALTASARRADTDAVVRRQGRELFFVPWRGLTMVGTDYLPVSPDADSGSRPDASAVEAFVETIAAAAPAAAVSLAAVRHVHWGLLPLRSVGDELPAKTPVVATGPLETGVNGLTVVIGEKLTSAPVLSERVVARLGAGSRGVRSVAAGVHRPGLFEPAVSDVAARVSPAVQERLAARYASDWPAVAAAAVARPDWLEAIAPGCPVLGVEVVHAVRHEMAATAEDVLARRVGAGIEFPASAALIARVEDLMVQARTV